MSVPYIFSNVPGGSNIPLYQLDANFAYLATSPTLTDLTLTGNLSVGGTSAFTGPATFNAIAINGAITIDGQTVNPTGVTGQGLLVFNTNPTLVNANLVTPILGTPQSGTLTNCTGLPLTTGVTGILPLSNGGTGASTQPAALNNLLPPQTGHAGQVLITDGAGNVTWTYEIQTVQNIAALRAIAPVTNQNVNVGGYYADGDGGGGQFYGVTGAPAGTYVDNGGTVILPTGGIGQEAWIRIVEDSINIRMFGAKGDGISDDYLYINKSLLFASTKNMCVVVPSGTYRITAAIQIKNGVRGFIGEGGTVKGDGAFSVILLMGINSGEASNVSNCTIQNIIFDANNIATGGVWAENVNNCIITHNKIYNLPSSVQASGIMLRTYKSGASDTYNNIITDNIVFGSNAVSGTTVGGVGISLDCNNSDLNYGATGFTNPTDYWKGTFTAAAGTYTAFNNIIANNQISGGYYGISLSAASYNNIENNKTSYNIRGVSIQNCSNYNIISGNIVTNNLSSGIHLAFGSSDNLITGNQIYSFLAVGEGQLQAYIGCINNKFTNNSVVCLDANGPQYFAYTAIKSDYNEFSNNNFTGNVSLACIGSESAWNTATTNPASRAYLRPAVGNNWTNAGMTSVNFMNNIINTGKFVPAIFCYQVSESGVNYSLTNYSINGNTILTGLCKYQLELSEDVAGNLNNFVVMNNNFYPIQDNPMFFSMTSGRRGLAKCIGNAILNDQNIAYNFPSGTTAPSVASLDYVSTAGYVAPTTIVNFTGGMNGQIIIVRLSVNTTIQNNASIVLKGGVNITGVNSNTYITLINQYGVWVELSRNF